MRSRTALFTPALFTSRRLAGAAVACAAVLTVGACSSDSTPTSASSTAESIVAQDHNVADVTFSADMIPHHRQAVEMAKLAPSRASDPRVIALAAQIEAAQAPEIDELTGRLRSWGQPVPTQSSMGGESMGGTPMNGMMSAGDMAELAGLRGAAFDTMWVSMMIEHHTGAVAMSRTELTNGIDRASKKLAENIIATQQSEIARMRTILAG